MAAPDNNLDDLDSAWDEGRLGQDEDSVRPSTQQREKEVEDAAGLQMISVRLQKELIDQLKFIADYKVSATSRSCGTFCAVGPDRKCC